MSRNKCASPQAKTDAPFVWKPLPEAPVHQVRPNRKGATFCGKATKRVALATTIHFGATCKPCRRHYTTYAVGTMRRRSRKK